MTKPSRKNDSLIPTITHDAVVIVPGIMGSELFDAETGEMLWGLRDPRWYVWAWTSRRGLDGLHVTPAEREGDISRVRPGKPLRVPAFAPMLRGAEPYTHLVNEATALTAHPDAVLEFGYDWRLSVAHNASLLVHAARCHLDLWRRHDAGSTAARLVIIAHSMGGLLAQSACRMLSADDVRATITLGTPFHGAVKTVSVLSAGMGAPLPLPHERLRAFARTAPGLYDLLPLYSCVEDGQAARNLRAEDLAALGANGDLAEQSLTTRRAAANGTVHGLRAIVGWEQPTAQSLRVVDGTAVELFHRYQRDNQSGWSKTADSGDGTVTRASAIGPGQPMYVAQTHGALPRTKDVLTNIRAMLSENSLGASLAGPPLSIEVPDVITTGEGAEVIVRSSPGTGRAGWEVIDVATGRPVKTPDLTRRDGVAVGRLRLREAGLYRVRVKAGGQSAVTQLVLAIPPRRHDDD